ncbi:MAG: glycoside hydrolase [Myxococcales bacterium]
MKRFAASLLLPSALAFGQTVTVDPTTRFQTLDGFGTCLSGSEAQQSWWQQLYFDDLQASIFRVDITPTFTATYSNLSYCSPWFGQPAPLNLDTAASGHAGPAGTNTRPYTSAADYSNAFGGCSAPIAVMGPDIDQNVKLFDFTQKADFGKVAQLGQAAAAQLGGFKLYASLWSPAPWVKKSSGNSISAQAWPLPTAQPWPFIWGGNFAGGEVDVSGTPLPQFNDGTADTSALTQFARGLAAFLRGFQNSYGVPFYAISLQNELTFEEFYNSATYPLTSMYIAALIAARAELDKYPDLASIRIVGPEDLMGGDAYGMWQYGSGATEVDKNLHFLRDVQAEPDAGAALAGFAIHGYAADGISSAGASPQLWDDWANGWQASPAGGIPADVAGFTSFGKPSWMTETSGEKPEWLASSQGPGGFPDQGAFSIAVKLQEALTTGQESAWLYWQLTDGKPSDDSDVQTLTDATQQGNAPKYVAVKHFFRFLRPGARRVAAAVTGDANLLASAFVLGPSFTAVLVNEGASTANVQLALPAELAGPSLSAVTSSDGSYWQLSTIAVASGSAAVPVPGYGVVTLTGAGASGDGGVSPPDAGTPQDAGVNVGDAGRPPDGGAADAGATAKGDGGVPVATGGCNCAQGEGLPSLALGLVVCLWLASRRRSGRSARG